MTSATLRVFCLSAGILGGAVSIAQAETAPAEPQPAAAASTSDAPAAPVVAPPAAAPAPATTRVKVGANTLPVPPEGMGQIVFYRPSKLPGMAVSYSVREDGKGISKLSNGSYLVWPTTPGAHTYTTESEATDSLTLEIDAGESYYIQQTLGMGVMLYRPHLAPSTADAFGKKSLKLSTRKGNDDPDLARNQAASTPAKN